jgi:hypothetical protein
MGIPSLVTRVPGIPRTHQLRIIGNGVVPQQAALALRLLVAAAAAPDGLAPPAGAEPDGDGPGRRHGPARRPARRPARHLEAGLAGDGGQPLPAARGPAPSTRRPVAPRRPGGRP